MPPSKSKKLQQLPANPRSRSGRKRGVPQPDDGESHALLSQSALPLPKRGRRGQSRSANESAVSRQTRSSEVASDVTSDVRRLVPSTDASPEEPAELPPLKRGRRGRAQSGSQGTETEPRRTRSCGPASPPAPAERKDAISSLPADVLELIARCLSVRDILNCSLVCRHWLSVFRSKACWADIPLSLRIDTSDIRDLNSALTTVFARLACGLRHTPSLHMDLLEDLDSPVARRAAVQLGKPPGAGNNRKNKGKGQKRRQDLILSRYVVPHLSALMKYDTPLPLETLTLERIIPNNEVASLLAPHCTRVHTVVLRTHSPAEWAGRSLLPLLSACPSLKNILLIQQEPDATLPCWEALLADVCTAAQARSLPYDCVELSSVDDMRLPFPFDTHLLPRISTWVRNFHAPIKCVGHVPATHTDFSPPKDTGYVLPLSLPGLRCRVHLRPGNTSLVLRHLAVCPAAEHVVDARYYPAEDLRQMLGFPSVACVCNLGSEFSIADVVDAARPRPRPSLAHQPHNVGLGFAVGGFLGMMLVSTVMTAMTIEDALSIGPGIGSAVSADGNDGPSANATATGTGAAVGAGVRMYTPTPTSATFPHLKELYLETLPLAELYPVSVSFPNLTALHIEVISFTDGLFPTYSNMEEHAHFASDTPLPTFPRLTTLHLGDQSSSEPVFVPPQQQLNAVLTHIAQTSVSLTSLDISCGRIYAPTLSALLQLPLLQVLKVQAEVLSHPAPRSGGRHLPPQPPPHRSAQTTGPAASLPPVAPTPTQAPALPLISLRVLLHEGLLRRTNRHLCHLIAHSPNLQELELNGKFVNAALLATLSSCRFARLAEASVSASLKAVEALENRHPLVRWTQLDLTCDDMGF